MKNIATILAAFVTATASVHAASDLQITEILYTGMFGEFIEVTNVGSTAETMTGWKYSDSHRGLSLATTATATDLSNVGGGSLASGKSFIITEVSSTIFIQAWYTEPGKTALATNLIVANNAINLGRTDEVNIYAPGATDGVNGFKDRITYFDDSTHPRSEDVSAIPKLNDYTKAWDTSGTANWQLSAVGTGFAWKAGVQGSVAGNPIPGPVGSPGVFPNL